MFVKTKDNTSLHVVFQGNIHLANCGSVAVLCLLTQLCGSPIATRLTTDTEQNGDRDWGL